MSTPSAAGRPHMAAYAWREQGFLAAATRWAIKSHQAG